MSSDSQPNEAITSINAQNSRCLEHIEKFRTDYRKGRATFNDFSRLKHRFPFFGFVPCQAGSIDFVMFHANDDIVAWQYLWFGNDSYEKEIVLTWLDWCREPGVVLDIGGYTGLMALLATKSHPDTTVHLFEPMERTIERAKINIRANNLTERITLHDKAASDKNREATINLYREKNFLGTGNSIYDKGLHRWDVKSIQCVAIDTFLPDIEPHLVKIDVEGHEKACLEGMKKTILRTRPKVMVEIWEHDRPDVLEMFQSMGYTCTPFDQNERRVMNYKCLPR